MVQLCDIGTYKPISKRCFLTTEIKMKIKGKGDKCRFSKFQNIYEVVISSDSKG